MLNRLRASFPNFALAWGFAIGVASFLGWGADKLIPDDFSLSANQFRWLIVFFFLIYIGSVMHLVFSIPRVVFASPDLLLYKGGEEYPEGIFQFAPSEWLIYNANYALFIIENESFERLLCVARVFNIQDDKKVQLIVVSRAKGTDSIWVEISKNVADFKRRIIIKPGVPGDEP